MPELEDREEEVKLRLVGAYDKLVRKGLITEAEFESIIGLLENLDKITADELKARLAGLGARKISEGRQ